jgi:hypothetical protein
MASSEIRDGQDGKLEIWVSEKPSLGEEITKESVLAFTNNQRSGRCDMCQVACGGLVGMPGISSRSRKFVAIADTTASEEVIFRDCGVMKG